MALKAFFKLIILVAISAGSCVTSLSELSRRKRTDDAGPLETVVENLSQQVSSLTAQLTQQANSFNALLNAANARIATLEAKTASLQKEVAFYAHSTVHPIHTGPHATLILNQADTNVGNAYDPDTGFFTVPVSGLYDFQANFLPFVDTDKVVYAGIYVDGQMKSEGVADSRHGFWDQTTIRSVVHVTSGQKVTLRNVDNAVKQFYAGLYTTFSGVLLKAD